MLKIIFRGIIDPSRQLGNDGVMVVWKVQTGGGRQQHVDVDAGRATRLAVHHATSLRARLALRVRSSVAVLLPSVDPSTSRRTAQRSSRRAHAPSVSTLILEPVKPNSITLAG